MLPTEKYLTFIESNVHRKRISGAFLGPLWLHFTSQMLVAGWVRRATLLHHVADHHWLSSNKTMCLSFSFLACYGLTDWTPGARDSGNPSTLLSTWPEKTSAKILFYQNPPPPIPGFENHVVSMLKVDHLDAGKKAEASFWYIPNDAIACDTERE